jgi:hypothetical protein
MPRQYTRIPPEARFWSHVDKSGECWLWTASCTKGGYGTFSPTHATRELAHRFAYALTHGPIPEGMHVLHNCPGGDNPACCNPAHLWLGTPAQNSADMVAKGRSLTGNRHPARLHPERMQRGDRHYLRLHPEKHPRGERHPNAKLTEDQVREIRALAKTMTQRSIARQYGLPEGTISRIILRRSWRHVA